MMEDFSDLALPPLFGGHILEAELETEGVEFVDGGGVSESQVEEESQERERRESERARDRRKYCNLSRRCREIEQVNERTLNRLHQVQKLSRQLKKERRSVRSCYCFIEALQQSLYIPLNWFRGSIGDVKISPLRGSCHSAALHKSFASPRILVLRPR
ncbi:UNVERIFIED_CONTAM: hypothetical protein FKN15_005427 [Acipenser sinensis]